MPEDVRQVVSSWKQLVSRIPALDRTMLAEAKVSVSDSGALILAFSKQTPADYFRQETASEYLGGGGRTVDGQRDHTGCPGCGRTAGNECLARTSQYNKRCGD